MIPNVGSASLVLPMLRSLEPTQSESYLTVADNLLMGAAVLEAAPACPPHALAMLCAHSLECILKAYLARFDDPVLLGWLKEKAGHDIVQLWAKAVQEGLAIESPMPDWVQRLAELHGWPFILRYARGANAKESHIRKSDRVLNGLHGITFPVLKGLPQQLSELAGKVRIQLQQVPR